MWHRWDHENHVKPGEDFADGMIAWHTDFAKTLADGIRPSVIQVSDPVDGVTHIVVPHPTQVMLHNHLPAKPVRR